MIKLQKKDKSVIFYLFFGVLTTVINIVVYALFTKVFNIEYMISNVIAWTIAVIFAYLTNKKYVFEYKTARLKEAVEKLCSFFASRLLTLLLDIAIMYIGISVMHLNDIVVKVFANVIVIVSNYYLSKYIVFKNRKEP